MTKQDTFDKLRHNIYAGMSLEHKYRCAYRTSGYDWFCTITKIDEASNNLEVTITGESGHSHTEDWDMAITVGGLAYGQYIEINGERK